MRSIWMAVSIVMLATAPMAAPVRIVAAMLATVADSSTPTAAAAAVRPAAVAPAAASEIPNVTNVSTRPTPITVAASRQACAARLSPAGSPWGQNMPAMWWNVLPPSSCEPMTRLSLADLAGRVRLVVVVRHRRERLAHLGQAHDHLAERVVDG